MQAKGEYVSPQANLQRCARPPEIPYGIMNDREFLCPKEEPGQWLSLLLVYAQISSYYFYTDIPGAGLFGWRYQRYLLGGEEIRFDEFVEQQYDKLLLMRQELDRKICTIAGTRQILDQIRIADQGHPVIREIGVSWYFIFTEVISKPATSSGEIEKDIRRHLKRCDNPGIQAFPMGASIDKEQFLRENYTYKNVFSFTEEGCRNKEDIVEMEPGEYLAAVCRESDGDIRDTYREIKDLMKKESKQFDSDIYRPEYRKRHRSE